MVWNSFLITSCTTTVSQGAQVRFSVPPPSPDTSGGKDISLVAAIRIVKPLNGVDNNACDKRSMQSNVAHPVK